MNNFISKFLIVLTFVFLSGINVSAQSEESYKPEFSVRDQGSAKAIIYAKENDGLPEEIIAKGKIVDASVSDTYCGGIATGGMLKIKLDEKIKNYNDDFLYVVVLCLAGEENENLVGKQIDIKVKKMTEFPYKFDVWLSNGIASNGNPFYFSTVGGIGGLLK